MPHLRQLPQLLQQLSDQGLLRTPDDQLVREQLKHQWGAEFLDLSSNDYLGLAALPPSPTRSPATAGAGASRLIHGSRPEHLALEAALADWVASDAALLFSTAYAANVGTLAALAGPEDVLFSDALNHASIVDGCRLSKAPVHVFAHLDLDDLRRKLEGAPPPSGARWVVVESYYSMDGTSPDLRGLRALCDQYDACLYVDEAHSLGVFGPQGAGLCREVGVTPDVLLGALGKAVGSQGAFVAGSSGLRAWLWNRARSFVFSTAPSPALAASALEQVHRARAADDARRRLHELAQSLRFQLSQKNIPLVDHSHGPILGVLLGEPERALRVATALRERGILTQAIRPPTVPPHTARLRLTVGAHLKAQDVDRVATLLHDILPTS